MPTSWKNDKWFVSSWNYNTNVISEVNFADKIQFHDVTLSNENINEEKLLDLGISKFKPFIN